MGQCFGTDCAGLCPRWSYRQQKGFDRYTKFAPKNHWKYADEHLLNEIQDPRSDDDLDFSDISSELSPKRNRHEGLHQNRHSRESNEKSSRMTQQSQQNTQMQQHKPEYSSITIEA